MTNIVTAVEIHDKNAADSPLLPALPDTTKKIFTLFEVSADKGYFSYDNARLVANNGAVPFIAFKNNSGLGDYRKEGRGKVEASVATPKAAICGHRGSKRGRRCITTLCISVLSSFST